MGGRRRRKRKGSGDGKERWLVCGGVLHGGARGLGGDIVQESVNVSSGQRMLLEPNKGNFL